jgi:hypothetical protein
MTRAVFSDLILLKHTERQHTPPAEALTDRALMFYVFIRLIAISCTSTNYRNTGEHVFTDDKRRNAKIGMVAV